MDYYVLERENNNNYPLLEWEDKFRRKFSRREPITADYPVKLCLGEPIPKKPEMVDFHKLPHPVFSKKVTDSLEGMNIQGVQLVPAVVNTEFGDFDYWILHVMNVFGCLDLEKSKYEADEDDGDILILEKIVFLDDAFDDIPEDGRLIFRIGEYKSMRLYHRRVKDRIESVNPKGLRFFHVDDWNDTVGFS